MPNPCICNLKNYMGREFSRKLTDVLNDGAGSPGALSARAHSQAAKLHDTKSVVSVGIRSFKDRFGLPPGRVDGTDASSLSEIKAKAEELKSKADEALTAISEFLTEFPECGANPDVVALVDTLSSIDSKLDPWSVLDTDKLDQEILDARAALREANAMMQDAGRMLDLLGECG